MYRMKQLFISPEVRIITTTIELASNLLIFYLWISWRIAIDVFDDPGLDPCRCWEGDVGEPWATMLGPGPTKDIDIIPALTDPGLAPLP